MSRQIVNYGTADISHTVIELATWDLISLRSFNDLSLPFCQSFGNSSIQLRLFIYLEPGHIPGSEMNTAGIMIKENCHRDDRPDN
jgi:hypothetical protein